MPDLDGFELQSALALVGSHRPTLTPREREVLAHVIAGRMNKQIAGDLGTVEKTIKVHRSRMMQKLGVRAVADLVRMVGKLNLTKQGDLPLAQPSVRPQ
jgi:DNA-binding NarL/FixJ family response regulator